MAHTVFCVRNKKEMEGLDEPPFDSEFGQKIFKNVSKAAWGEWVDRQKMLLNEYRLQPWTRRRSKFLSSRWKSSFLAQARRSPRNTCRPRTETLTAVSEKKRLILPPGRIAGYDALMLSRAPRFLVLSTILFAGLSGATCRAQQGEAAPTVRYHFGDDPDGKLGWASPNFDDSSWPIAQVGEIPAPAFYSNGMVWVRARVAASKNATGPLGVALVDLDHGQG